MGLGTCELDDLMQDYMLNSKELELKVGLPEGEHVSPVQEFPFSKNVNIVLLVLDSQHAPVRWSDKIFIGTLKMNTLKP